MSDRKEPEILLTTTAKLWALNEEVYSCNELAEILGLTWWNVRERMKTDDFTEEQREIINELFKKL